jgi:hypothetical protein
MLAVYLDRHNWLDFSTAGSLQLQATSKFVTPLGHIIMIPSQLLFGLTPLISEEAANTKFLVFDFTMEPPKLTIYRTRSEHANHNYQYGSTQKEESVT